MDSWFRKVRSEFAPQVLPFKGQAITYVEIGVFSGASAEYVCQNVLTHPESKGYGIDPYLPMRRRDQRRVDQVKQHAIERLSPHSNWTLITGTSHKVLRRWRQPIDLLYIDGSHLAPDVVMDFALAWPHMRVGSRIVFDDYGIGHRKNFSHVPEAVKSIESSFSGFVKRSGTPNKQIALDIISKTYDAKWFKHTRAVKLGIRKIQ